MTFERTYDYALLRQFIVRDPRLYEAMADDFAPSIEEFSIAENDGIQWVLAKEEEEILGAFMLIEKSRVLLELHTAMPTWGPKPIEAMRGLFAWVWANTDCQRLMTWTGEHNKLVRRFGKKAGFVEFAVNPCSFQKDGVLQAQIWMGITRPKAEK